MRSALLLGTVWACTVVVVAIVTWQVIHTAGRGILDESSGSTVTRPPAPTSSPTADSVWQPGPPPPTTRPSPSALVTGPSSSATADTASPSPSHASATPTHAASSSVPPPSHSSGAGPGGHQSTLTASPTPPPVSTVDSWRGDAGVVTVGCAPGRIQLLGATPNDGYRLEVEQEADTVQVHFQREQPDDEVQVQARCTGGVPHFDVEQGNRADGESSSGPVTS